MATNDGAGPKRTASQPTPVQAESDSRRGGETRPQATVAYSGSKQGLPQMFGRYRVQRLLGGGGMGAVYLVVNTELEREEALKVAHFDVADDPTVRERFLREAKSAAKLDHPNLCPVYDVGVLDGVYYLTMRYLKGKLLSDYTGTAQPSRKVVETVTKLAQALTAAHAKGVIHRDLKPNNVMMCAGVGPVVMDFGLAKQTGRQGRQLTQLGTTLGTPAYMPPEQVKGELDRMGPAGDVYSLGVILFELLTGTLPFTGGTVEEVYGKILYAEPPAPSALRPGLPAALNAICAKAMAKEPEGRYPSMKDFAAALIGHLKATPPTEDAGNLTATKATPADIFQMPTAAPATPKTPLRRGEILAAPTQIKDKAPSSGSKSGVRQDNLWAAVVAGAEEKRGGRSSGALPGWALGGAMVLAGLLALGALVFVLNQKKTPPTSPVAAVTPPLSASTNEKPVDAEPVGTKPMGVKPPVIVPQTPPVVDPSKSADPEPPDPTPPEIKPSASPPPTTEQPNSSVTEPSQSPDAAETKLKWCAIAYSDSTGRYGYAFGSSSSDVDNTAINGCKAWDAKIIVRSEGGWCALALSEGRVYASANGSTAAEARQKALRVLSNFAANPRIAVCISAND